MKRTGSDANDQRSDHAKRRIGNTTGTHLQRSTASQQIGIPMAMGALASLGDDIVDEIVGDGRRKKSFGSKKGAPRRKHKGKFHNLGNKLATSTGNQIKKFFKKKKTRRMAKKALHKVGRELFALKKLRLESKPHDTFFAKKTQRKHKDGFTSG